MYETQGSGVDIIERERIRSVLLITGHNLEKTVDSELAFLSTPEKFYPHKHFTFAGTYPLPLPKKKKKNNNETLLAYLRIVLNKAALGKESKF